MGTEYRTMDCKELTILTSLTDQTGMSSHTERATGFTDVMNGADWWRDITWGRLTRKRDFRGCPPWVHFFGRDPKAWREWVIGPWNP